VLLAYTVDAPDAALLGAVITVPIGIARDAALMHVAGTTLEIMTNLTAVLAIFVAYTRHALARHPITPVVHLTNHRAGLITRLAVITRGTLYTPPRLLVAPKVVFAHLRADLITCISIKGSDATLASTGSPVASPSYAIIGASKLAVRPVSVA
jgi:hypothetical protein